MEKMTRKGIITMVSMLFVFVTGAYGKEKEITVGAFNGIRTETTVNIRFTQGAEYSVKVSGTDEQLEHLSVDVKDSVLVIDSKKERRRKGEDGRNVIQMEITAPRINTLYVGGVTQFTAQRIKADSFLIKTSGVSTFDCEELECRQFTSKTSGVSKLKGTVKGDRAILKCSGVNSSDMAFRVRGLDIACSGTCSSSFDFKGDEAEIRGTGTGNITMKVDCKKVMAHSSGVCRITLSGTADDTEIRSSGVSRVDTSGLNRF